MGRDIHAFIEVRKSKKSAWEFFGNFYEDDFKLIKSKSLDRYIPIIFELSKGRNYFLFAILAGFNNENNVRTIKETSGLPEGLSFGTKVQKVFWNHGHSHNWFTLKELMDYDWNQTQSFTGIVNLNEFKTYLEKGWPDAFMDSDTCLEDLDPIFCTSKDMERALRAENSLISEANESRMFTRLTWERSYREMCDYFVRSFERLKTLGDPENIRIIIWFDN